MTSPIARTMAPARKTRPVPRAIRCCEGARSTTKRGRGAPSPAGGSLSAGRGWGAGAGRFSMRRRKIRYPTTASTPTAPTTASHAMFSTKAVGMDNSEYVKTARIAVSRCRRLFHVAFQPFGAALFDIVRAVASSCGSAAARATSSSDHSSRRHPRGRADSSIAARIRLRKASSCRNPRRSAPRDATVGRNSSCAPGTSSYSARASGERSPYRRVGDSPGSPTPVFRRDPRDASEGERSSVTRRSSQSVVAIARAPGRLDRPGARAESSRLSPPPCCRRRSATRPSSRHPTWSRSRRHPRLPG